MTSVPGLGALAALSLLILVSRPWLEARRPAGSLPLLAGMVLGPGGAGVLTADLTASLDPLVALAGGWLCLLAAESWGVAAIRKAGVAAIARAAIPGLACCAGVILILVWQAGARPGVAAMPALLLACVASARDPEAARDRLSRSGRPPADLRRLPSIISLAVGMALAGSALAASLATHLAPVSFALLTVLAGGTLGMGGAALIRLAQGKGPIMTVLLALAILGWGLAASLGMSPAAVVFCAGVVLANDLGRRDLTFTALRELERPLTPALLLLAGATVPLSRDIFMSGTFWSVTLGLVLLAGLSWRVAARGAAGLPLSPLAIVLALLPLGWPGDALGLVDRLPAAVCVAYLVAEGWWAIRGSRS